MVVIQDSQCRFFTLSETAVAFLLCCPKVQVFAGVDEQGNMGERGVPRITLDVLRDGAVVVLCSVGEKGQLAAGKGCLCWCRNNKGMKNERAESFL